MNVSNGFTPNFLNSIDWGTQVSTNSIDVYFAPRGVTYDGERSVGWSSYEIQQAMLAFERISDVTNLTFNRVFTPVGAEFRLVIIDDRFAPFLGYFYPPGLLNEGIGVFNRAGTGWDQQGGGGLEPGGLGFAVLLHEIAHGLGFAHPHDTGGGSTIWQGVTQAFDSYGTGNQNQGVFTTMSYNDGWATQPGGSITPVTYGAQASMMAYDVALLQSKYGANTTFAAGNTDYALPGSNGVGTSFTAIWDTGGVDTISYSGRLDATLDLRAASLVGPNGGGFVSYAAGIHGGFTIANGVVIENARSGGGDDTLVGNKASNDLRGGGADDTLYGLTGNDFLHGEWNDDTLYGGWGNDWLFGKTGTDYLSGGQGRDRLFGGGGNDQLVGGAGGDRLTGGRGDDEFIFSASAFDDPNGAAETIRDFGNGNDTINFAGIDAVVGGADDAFTFIGNAAFSGTAGELRFAVNTTTSFTRLSGDMDGDGVADFTLYLKGEITFDVSDFVL